SGDFPGQREHAAANANCVAGAVAAVPPGVRCRPDQNPPRPVLARPDVPVLPPRDPADAEPAELVFSPPAEMDAPHGGAWQSHRPAGGRVGVFPATANRRYRGADHDRAPGLVDPVGQLRLVELVDTGPGGGCIR